MKSVIGRISVLLAVLHLAGNVNTESVRAQTLISTPNKVGNRSLAQSPTLLAQAAQTSDIQRTLDRGKIAEAVLLIEHNWVKKFEAYFGRNFPNHPRTVEQAADTLSKIATQTGKKPALIYIVPQPQHLELVLVTPEGEPIHQRISAANKEALLQQVQEFTNSIVSPARRNTNRYLAPAQQLYQWMIAPLEAELQAQNIDTLLFCLGPGLRTMPVAALHDGQQFLVEKYSFARIPAFNLIDTNYAHLENSQVLAMGASEFRDEESLPAVPVELSTITTKLWQGESFLNQEFTLANLQLQRQQQPFKIIHLATHASFESGVPSNSYVQFWDTKLTLDQMKQLQWNNPPVELLVLSACKTAIGDEQAELGFAGLAVQTSVKSAIASLWNVSDEGTLALMTEFYQDLKTAPIKAEALRQAQLALLNGQVSLIDGQLRSSIGSIPLPPALAKIENQNFSHPYYWAAFTVVGSPW